MKFGKKFIIAFLTLIILMVSIFPMTKSVSANFVDTIGMGQKNSKYIGEPAPPSVWLNFSREINSNNTGVLSWSGYPLLGMMNHIMALAVGYPDAQGRAPINRGLLSGLSNLTGLMYQTTPASSTIYLASISDSLGIGTPKKIFAAGADFYPNIVFKIWIEIRNVAYVFFIVIFVAIGFMIMFRFKLNPQTSVSIQNSLPNIAISLIAVSISYAIVGLAIDIVTIGNKLIEFIFLSGPLKGGASAENINILTLILSGQWGGQNAAKLGWDLITKMLNFDPAGLLSFLTIMILLSSSVGIFMALLSRYVSLVLSAIFSPLIIMFGALPGKSDILTKFIKSVFVSALSFPAVYALLLISSDLATNSTDKEYIFNVLGVFSVPVGAADNITKLVALGILMITPKIPDTISEAFEVKAGLGAGSEQIGGFLRRIPVIGGLLG